MTEAAHSGDDDKLDFLIANAKQMVTYREDLRNYDIETRPPDDEEE